MKYYLGHCEYCGWKGNRAHRDGQCPVCGHAVRVRVRARRYSPDLASRIVLSGLSADRRLPGLSEFLHALDDYRQRQRRLLRYGMWRLRILRTGAKNLYGNLSGFRVLMRGIRDR